MPALKLDLLATRLAPVVCIVAACACASTAGPLSAKENTTMTESAPPKTTLSARQLNDKILALILSANDARDLSPEGIERHTGLQVNPNPEDPFRFYSVGALPDGWFFSLTGVKPDPGAPQHSVLLRMSHGGDGYTDRTPVCIGLAHYQSALTAAGFKASQRPPRLGTEYRFFRSDKVSVRVELQGQKTLYDKDLCVSRVFISAQPQG
ncbi:MULTISPECIES: hypothetical protein [Lysobacter]|uniref:hypothetical protein n=1 Tax=Lysobacter TaxID=68 RepID=UPI001F1BED59|nr:MULTISPECIES: hypothetical protein [Lysobacter]UJB19237.1 hypothetical protein L1A79_23480 [Lysobacter capsici]UJQ27038.1 hypothetical protein L2D09_16405 [Lysobacter gummosus]